MQFDGHIARSYSMAMEIRRSLKPHKLTLSGQTTTTTNACIHLKIYKLITDDFSRDRAS